MNLQVKSQDGAHTAEHLYVYSLPIATALSPAMLMLDKPTNGDREKK